MQRKLLAVLAGAAMLAGVFVAIAPTPAEAATTPDAMASVIAVAGDRSVEVTWTTGNVGWTNIDTFKVELVESGGYVARSVSLPSYADGAGQSFSYTFPALNGLYYTTRVSGKNMQGWGPSASSDVVHPCCGVPEQAPGNVSATGGDALATVTWSRPLADGGGITHYQVYSVVNGVEDESYLTSGPDLSMVVPGLVNGTTYSFKVRAWNGDGFGPKSVESNAITPATKPGAPTVGATMPGNQKVILNWTAPASNGGSPITGYVVTPYIGATAQSVRTFNSTATTQTITGLTNGTTYTFTVTAKNALGTGPKSNWSNEVTPAPVPDAPTIGTAVPADSKATVSWTPPADDGGSPITGYVVTPYIGATAQTPITFNSTATTQTITGLTNGTTYTFTVAAFNAIGTGNPSAVSGAATPATVPGLPGTPIASAGNQKVILNWTAPASNGGSPITGYVVTPYIGATAQSVRTFNSTATTQTITGLTNGTTYTFTVTAKNALGTGNPSAASAPIAPATPPGAPTGGTAVAGDGQATFTWIAPVSDGGSAITGYEVTQYKGTEPERGWNLPLQTSYTATGLTNGQQYRFSVRAKNAIGFGPSAISNAVTPGIPGIPTDVMAAANDAQAAVTWTAPSSIGGSPLTGYVVTPYIGATAQTPITFNSTATTQTITGLTNGTTYTFTVAAFNAIGTGGASAASTAVTPPGLPSAPSVGVAAFDNGTATFSWTAPSSGGSPIQGYVITPYVGAIAQPEAIYDSTATTQTVFNLTNGTTYTFRVAAFNAVGTGPQSMATNAVTPGAVPSAPTIGTAAAANAQVALSWAAPTLNAGRPLLGYVVTPYIGATAQTPITFNSTATTQTITGLTNGTTYTFKVAAINAIGTGPPSSASSAVTPKAAPSFAPFASWVTFVKRQYLDLTTKAPSSGQLSTWTVGLTAGTVTKGDLIETLRRSTDNTTNVDPTARLYRAFLGRAPDAGGLRFWIGRKRAGTWTVTRMADSFAASNEFKAKYGTLTNHQFVTRIYTDVLGRTADTAGVNYWTSKLDRKEKTRGGVMVGFSESNEYKRKQAETTDVAIAHIFLMGRAPTGAETTDWVTRQKAGTSQATLATELLNSTKYATHITG